MLDTAVVLEVLGCFAHVVVFIRAAHRFSLLITCPSSFWTQFDTESRVFSSKSENEEALKSDSFCIHVVSIRGLVALP